MPTPRKKRVDPAHPTTPAARLAADVAAMLALRAKASGLYKEAAQQEEELIARMEHANQRTVELEGGVCATLVDNFATSNVAWKSAKSQRKEIKIV